MRFANHVELCLHLENAFDAAVEQRLTPNHRWRENGITEALLAILAEATQSAFVGTESLTFDVRVNAQKLVGRRENLYGDVCLLVDVRRGGQFFQGVAHFEAKKQSLRPGTFSELHDEQIDRITSRSSGALTQLALYLLKPRLWTDDAFPGLGKHLTASRVLTTPARSWLSKHKLLPFFPLSAQISFRYLFGYDIDMDRSALSAAMAAAVSNYYVLARSDDGLKLDLARNIGEPLTLDLPDHLVDIRKYLELDNSIDESLAQENVADWDYEQDRGPDITL